jgi:hypothetical protein
MEIAEFQEAMKGYHDLIDQVFGRVRAASTRYRGAGLRVIHHRGRDCLAGGRLGLSHALLYEDRRLVELSNRDMAPHLRKSDTQANSTVPANS